MKNCLILMSMMLLILVLPGKVYAQFSINFSEETVPANGTVQVDVTTSGFSDIVLTQYSVNWDPNVLEFSDIINLTNELPGFSKSNFGLPPDDTNGPGRLRISWSEPSTAPVTIPNNTRLYTIVLKAIGNDCDSTEVLLSDVPSKIQVSDNDLNPVNVSSSPGKVKIEGADCTNNNGGGGDKIGFTASMESVAPGEDVCVEISVQNFKDIQSIISGLIWNPSILRFKDVQGFGSLPDFGGNNFNRNKVDDGELGFLWTDVTAENPLDLADGTIVFEACFEALGATGSMSPIDFAETGNFATDFTDSNDATVPHENASGKVTVEIIGGAGDFTLKIDKVQGMMGGEACVNFVAENFLDISSMQYTVSFDATKIRYNNSKNFALSGLSGSSFNPVTDSKVRLSWSSFDGSGIDLADGTSVYEMCFDVLGDCNSAEKASLDFINDGSFVIQIVKSPDIVVSPVNLVSGEIAVAPCGVNYQVLSITNVLCPGDASGSISIAITGASDACSCTWETAAGIQVSSGTIGGNNCSLLGQKAGTYTLRVSCPGEGQIFTMNETITEPAALELSGDVGNAGCGSGGSISVTATGGTPAYTITSNPAVANANNVAPGTYVYTVTDANGCTNSASFTVSDLTDDLSITGADITPVTCNGGEEGSIVITVVGGCVDNNGNYNISWTDADGNAVTGGLTVSSLKAGAYRVEITDSSTPAMSVVRTYTVIQPTAISANVASITPSTNGSNGEIELSVSGGAGSYNYVWTPDVGNTDNPKNLASGVYSVVITDADGCTATLSATVESGGPVLANIQATSAACSDACEGVISGDLTGGATPIVVTLSDGPTAGTQTLNALGSFSLEALCPGVYTLTATDANGDDVSIEDLEIEEAVAMELSTEIKCEDSGAGNGAIELTVTGGITPYTFDWSNNTSQQDLSDVGRGTYSVLVTDVNGCEAMLTGLFVQSCLSEDCYVGRSVITPNGDGKNDVFTITCLSGLDSRLGVYDRSGIRVFETNNYNNDWGGTDASGNVLPEGSYMWVVEVDFGTGGREIYNGTLTLLRDF